MCPCFSYNSAPSSWSPSSSEHILKGAGHSIQVLPQTMDDSSRPKTLTVCDEDEGPGSPGNQPCLATAKNTDIERMAISVCKYLKLSKKQKNNLAYNPCLSFFRKFQFLELFARIQNEPSDCYG